LEIVGLRIKHLFQQFPIGALVRIIVPSSQLLKQTPGDDLFFHVGPGDQIA
jgi:hypothetical protein